MPASCAGVQIFFAMNITIVGTGYVGLVSGACFAEVGTYVRCVDIDARKIEMLQSGVMPIYEPGLDELVAKNVKAGRLSFSTSLEESLSGSKLVFCAVGTPPDEDGSADLSYVLEVARTVGRMITEYTVFVTKSTVPVGTAAKVKATIAAELAARGVDVEFDVASNPEFLKEGAAIKDFLSPERVIIGADSARAKDLLEKLYKPFMLKGYRVISMDVPSAEMTKYASNAMLATRISFMNDIANLCELLGADVDKVRLGMGSDGRIGKSFLYAGAGYGGSCFPKDVKALARTGRQVGYTMEVIEAVERVNDRQKNIVFEKLSTAFGGELKGKVVALWGLAFKPETDDMREAPSLVVIERLLSAGATVRVFDPVAMNECKRRIGDKVTYCADIYDAATGADAVALMTEWMQFRMPAWNKIQEVMRDNVVVDGRNIYDYDDMVSLGFRFSKIGKKKDCK